MYIHLFILVVVFKTIIIILFVRYDYSVGFWEFLQKQGKEGKCSKAEKEMRIPSVGNAKRYDPLKRI